MSAYESIIIGKDEPDSLFLYVYYLSPRSAGDMWNSSNNVYTILNSSELSTVAAAVIFFKNNIDNYNFEECLTKFINNSTQSINNGWTFNNVFILKNGQWFYYSFEDAILIPCERE